MFLKVKIPIFLMGIFCANNHTKAGVGLTQK